MSQKVTIQQHKREDIKDYSHVVRINGAVVSDTKETQDYTVAHFYEMKPSGTFEEAEAFLDEFRKWAVEHHGDYRFNAQTRMNEGRIPVGYTCWCSAMEAYLLEKGFYSPNSKDPEEDRYRDKWFIK